MRIIRALLLLLLFTQSGLAEEARTNKVVAIFPFHFASTDLAEKEAIQELNGLFYDLFAGQLVSTDFFEVVDRQHIAEMMEEVKLQLSGLTAGEVVQLGKAKGAELAIFGAVTKVGKQTFLTMKIIDIETTVIIKAIKQNKIRLVTKPLSVFSFFRTVIKSIIIVIWRNIYKQNKLR